MQPQSRIYMAAMLVASLGLSVFAQAEPNEKTQATINRTIENGLQLTGTLSKNVYTRKAFEEPYTVQEPYQEEETYYEQVPYQEQEEYYEEVPYQEQERYTEYEEYTDQEYRCERRTRTERVCRDVEDCHIVPGRGPDGGPRRECTRQPVCENVNRDYDDCGYHSVRKTRPVERTRWVTRYRQERRTRTVTKYRQERRTRTVTKYRDKVVCCETVYRDVFDHQYNVPVIVNFPAGTELLAGETESFAIKLGGTEKAPTVALTTKTSVFGYAVEKQEPHAGGVILTLKSVPLYTPEQLGTVSIQGLRLDEKGEASQIRFRDEGLKPRITTAYSYQITEAGSTEVLASGQLAGQQKDVLIPLQLKLEEMKEYQLQLRVARQGLPLSAPVDVTVSAIKKISPLKNEELYKRRDQINTFEIRGEGTNARVFFRDQTPKDEGVRTTYRMEVLFGDETAPVVAVKELERDAMPMGTNNFFKVMLAQDFGISANILNAKVRAGRLVTLRMTVTREHQRLNEGQPVVLKYQHVQQMLRE